MDSNPARGEVAAKIGDIEIVMAATMEGLARLSQATGCETLADFYKRLAGGEIATTMAAIRLFTIRGTDGAGKALKAEPAAKAALAALSIDDVVSLQGKFIDLMSALMRKPTGGDDAGKSEAAQA